MSVEVSAAALRDMMRARLEETERDLAQCHKDWDALVTLIAERLGNEDEREMAEAGEMEEFDPWACLRRYGKDKP